MRHRITEGLQFLPQYLNFSGLLLQFAFVAETHPFQPFGRSRGAVFRVFVSLPFIDREFSNVGHLPRPPESGVQELTSFRTGALVKSQKLSGIVILIGLRGGMSSAKR